jgi:hypothetical protein
MTSFDRKLQSIRRPPRVWPLVGVSLLAVSILGVLVVRAAPQQAEPKKEEPKKEEPKKEEPKKEQPAQFGPGQTEVEQLEMIYRDLLRGHTESLDAIRQLLAQHRLQFQQINRAMAQRRMAFAPNGVPLNRARVIDLLPTEEKSDKPEAETRLGVRLSPPTETLAEQMDLPREQGVVLTEVLPNTPADKAGLRSHDVLLELDGKPVPRTIAAVVRMISDLKANTPVEALVLRKGQQQKVKIASLPEARANQPEGGGPEIVPAPPRVGNWQTIPRANNPRMIGLPRIVNQAAVQPRAEVNPAPEPAGNGVTTTLFRSGDRFTARHQEGSLVITVTGTAAGGKSTLSQITVKEGGLSNTYRGVDAVPEEYRDKVKSLIDMAEKGNARVETRAP